MTNTSQKIIVVSMIVAGFVGLLSLLDLVMGIPFGKQTTMDIMFLIGTGLVIYMGVDSYKEME